MYGLKRMFTFFVATSLLAGFAVDTFAQKFADPQGVRIRVERIDHGEWAAIGDSIEVKVITRGTELSGVVVTIVAPGDTLALSTTQADDGLTAVRGYVAGDDDANDFAPNYTASMSVSGTDVSGPAGVAGGVSSASGATTFSFRFPVLATHNQESDDSQSLMVAAYVDEGDVGNDFKYLDNQMTDVQESVLFSADVGDGVLFGIDARRPDGDDVFTTVKIDTAALNALGNTSFLSSDERNAGKIAGTSPQELIASAKQGDKVTIEVKTQNILGSGAVSGEVHVVWADSTDDKVVDVENAFYSVEFTSRELFEGESKTFTVADGEGGNQKKAFGNRQRVKLIAFLVDGAGNRSLGVLGDDNDGDEIGRTMDTDPEEDPADAADFVYIIDSEKPTVTPTRPKMGTTEPDSLRFTAALTTEIDLIGVTDAEDYDLMPMNFAVDEPLRSLKVVFGDSTVTIQETISDDGAAVFEAADGANFAIDLGEEVEEAGETIDRYRVIPKADRKQGGNTFDVTIVAEDEVGNKTEEKIEGATLDVLVPTFLEVFPDSATAPNDKDNDGRATINPDTYEPTVRVSEALDSLVVRYVQVDGTDDDNVIYGVPRGTSMLTSVNSEYKVTFPEADTLIDDRKYSLQLVAFDLAGNVGVKTAAPADKPLAFTKGFANPEADSFVVEVDAESVIAGDKITVTITAIDSMLTREAENPRRAVIYAKEALLTVHTDNVNGLEINGDTRGVITDNGDGTATLKAEGWSAGRRTVEITSTAVLSEFSVSVVDLTGGTVNFRGDKGGLTVDAGEFSTYSVTALEDESVTTTVSGDFTVRVVPTDEYGNKSTKVHVAPADEDTPNTNAMLLDSEIPEAQVLDEILFTFSTNIGGAGGVPQGRQSIGPDGGEFIAGAPDRRSTGLVITVTSDAQYGPDEARETGSSASLSFVPFGEDPLAPPPSAVPIAVDTVVVEDYLGADGQGDQGGFALITFPNSRTHAGATYRVYRKIMVTVDGDGTGGLEEIEPADVWIAWSKIDAVPVVPGGSTITRAVVPVIDAGSAVATRWAIGVERGGLTSGLYETVLGKRVFTKESVQQMVRLLGVDPNRVISQADLEKLITPPKDYVKSILGDRKGILFAGLDPDPGRLLTQISVPQTIRTASGAEVFSSSLTVSEPVAVVDNIPPSKVTGSSGAVTPERTVNLVWTSSVDDKVVGTIVYNGHHIPIDGVRGYEILRGTDESSLETIATVDKGSEGYVDASLPEDASLLIYRIDAVDLDNRTEGALFEVLTGRREFFVVGPDGEPRECFVMEFMNTPNVVDFYDFVAFASAFGKSPGQPGYTVQADTDDSGTIDFADFVNFASCFGAELPGATKRAVATRTPGVNDNVELSMSLGSERVVAGETISVGISLANVEALTAYGLSLSYDPSRFEFVEAVAADEELLKSTGGDTPLFKTFQSRAGELQIANAVVHGSSVSGEGPILNVTFKVLREFEDMARFEIADGIVFDAESHSNPVVTLGALEVETTPAEFALLQNYPNPFNPETTIKYNLAETGDVNLRIYNIVGQVVRTLVAERQPAGRYEVRWSGTDDRGMAVSSGIYFYQITAGGFRDVKRLMLLK